MNNRKQRSSPIDTKLGLHSDPVGITVISQQKGCGFHTHVGMVWGFFFVEHARALCVCAGFYSPKNMQPLDTQNCPLCN